ncbi:MAG: ImmA/IrrE family metallo-endopeptidase [Candidatus Sedimenticola sp. (ex Thyasira tokunagai)]
MSTTLEQLISQARFKMQNPYAYSDDKGGFDAVANDSSTPIHRPPLSRSASGNQYAGLNGEGEIDYVSAEKAIPHVKQQSSLTLTQTSKDQLHSRVHKLVNETKRRIWKNRHQLWPEGVPTDPVDLLDPEIAIRMSGFEFEMADTLGEYSSDGRQVAVAGIIDQSTKSVRISRQLPHNTHRFTAAHELGHALLHEGMHMHRDRPLDSNQQTGSSRDRFEVEADKFATYFLMPEKLVRERFRQTFLCDQFTLTEESIFALDPSGSLNLMQKHKTPRDLAWILATAEGYNGKHFHSLASQFRVSKKAMAIRLEELQLIVAD